ncbi:alpha-L-rhamnosidase C-terminal domain-containing protein [Streptomyces sp. B6B3]|uniref:alpha-L-rhamnosidase-related protein n=1 Tax=Streptomyces sp. B6B3 TaxID=3153570 RepID=UPI00325D54B8
MAELTERGVRAVGVDPDERMIAGARGRWPEADFRIAEAYHLPLPDASAAGYRADVLVDSQRVYGLDGAQFTAVAPGNGYNAAEPISGWADCGVVVPWTLWQMTGDLTVVERGWPAMPRYVDWIRQRTGESYTGQGALFEVSAAHLSPHGEIASEWTVRGDTLSYRATVPANTTATLRIPAAAPEEVREDGTPLAEVPGVEYLGSADGTAAFLLPSGRYDLTSALG